jgi:hypothetical protein
MSLLKAALVACAALCAVPISARGAIDEQARPALRCELCSILIDAAETGRLAAGSDAQAPNELQSREPEKLTSINFFRSTASSRLGALVSEVTPALQKHNAGWGSNRFGGSTQAAVFAQEPASV